MASLKYSPRCSLAGHNRFETAEQILKAFSLDPSKVYLASGNNFPDALAESALASKTGDSIVLIDTESTMLPQAIDDYLRQLYSKNIKPEIVSFGGVGVVPDLVLKGV